MYDCPSCYDKIIYWLKVRQRITFKLRKLEFTKFGSRLAGLLVKVTTVITGKRSVYYSECFQDVRKLNQSVCHDMSSLFIF